MPAVAEVPALAHTPLGDLRGLTEGGVAVWRGVPYAHQPVGDRRFAAPVPLGPWTGVRDALEHGPLPPQSRSMAAGDRNDTKTRDEACLTLTIWSPDVAASLPVMVWIPGGAFLRRVTVFGESAGATSVLALLASPAADGLFCQAIAQSPALPLIAERETRAAQAQRFLGQLGLRRRS